MSDDPYVQAAQTIAGAEALLITAGAGMGVDSGLPDFRGDQGFWRAYPAYQKLGLSFVELANPRWFADDPALAWGFYGHRMNLYRATVPHEGFQILRRWAQRMQHGAHVFTSNVDGQFQHAGFDEQAITEAHGSIHFLQCVNACGSGIFPADSMTVVVDGESFRARDPLPACPSCGALARPNVLMFGDGDWIGERSLAQSRRLHAWLRNLDKAKLAIVEMGAGGAVPTVRFFSEQQLNFFNATLIRINPREYHAPEGSIGISSGALDALRRIDAELTSSTAA